MRRVDSWRLREEVREHRKATGRQRACGEYRYQKHVELRSMGEGTGAWWHGVIQCRARMCPVCWIARRHKAASEVAWTVYAREQDTAQQSWLLTLTVRHFASDPISLTRDVRGCWRSMIQSRAFQTWKRAHGLEWICAEEVTRGENGWHPHIHALLMPATKIDTRDPWSLSWAGGGSSPSALFRLWARTVDRRFRKKYGDHFADTHAPEQGPGLDLRECDAAGYLTKLGYELADPATQKGNAPLAMLSAGALDEYMELQQSRARARDITFSRGLREHRDGMPEGGEPMTLLGLRGSDWGRLRALGYDQPLAVCDAAKEGEHAARAELHRLLGPTQEPTEDDDHARWE